MSSSNAPRFLCMVCGKFDKSKSLRKEICQDCYVNLNFYCKECKEIKKVTEFHHGKKSACKACYSRIYSEINKKVRSAIANKDNTDAAV